MSKAKRQSAEQSEVSRPGMATTTESAATLLTDLTGVVEKLHGATFDPGTTEAVEATAANPSDPNTRIGELLGQIDQGVRDDDATNFEKLQIARRTGPLLLELKELVPHGSFKAMLKDRYPKHTYSKLNRWMFLAQREAEVEEASRAHPDVAWGPKKMIDYLRGVWVPNEDEEDDEEDAAGIVESPPKETGKPGSCKRGSQKDAAEAADEGDKPGNDDSASPNANDDDPTSADEEATGDTVRWEREVAKAEAEAAEVDGGETTEPAPALYAVTVMVFTESDQTAIYQALSNWSPISKTPAGNKQVRSVSAHVQSNGIGALLHQLGETLEQSQPRKVRVSIER